MEPHQATTKTFLFEVELDLRTTKRRRDLRGRVFMQSVIFDIRRVNSTTYRLIYIETFPLLRRCGHASLALSWLCRLADEHEVRLELCPVEMETDGLNTLQLTAWYQRFGFERIGMQDEMIRKPKRSFVEREQHERTHQESTQ